MTNEDKKSRDETECDACGRQLYDPVSDSTIVALHISVAAPENSVRHFEQQKLIDEFGKSAFNICFYCWVKSLGVKPIKRDEEQEK